MEWLESKGGSLYDQSLKFEENVSKLGAYACFCEYQMNNLMRPVDTQYQIEYKDVNGTMQEMSEPICVELDNYNGLWLAYGYYLCIFLSVHTHARIVCAQGSFVCFHPLVSPGSRHQRPLPLSQHFAAQPRKHLLLL